VTGPDRPRIVALTAFYDEPPALIATMINGLARLGVDHLVALDGAYRLYPDGKPGSHPDQWQALHGAFTFGMGVSLIVPRTTWAGNEVEKRTALFRHGLAHARPGVDWLLVADADEIYCVDPPHDLRLRLARTEHDAALVHVYDVESRSGGTADEQTVAQEFDTRRLYRAQEIVVERNHFTYKTRDGRVLWASGAPTEEPALDLTGVLAFEHRPGLRAATRQAAKWTYYASRDETGFERGDCLVCGVRARVRLPTGWKVRDGGFRANFGEYCAQHGRERDAMNRRQLKALGVLNPDDVIVQERYPPITDIAGAAR
jgi:hypothetical protein